jgi:hypothetical protein
MDVIGAGPGPIVLSVQTGLFTLALGAVAAFLVWLAGRLSKTSQGSVQACVCIGLAVVAVIAFCLTLLVVIPL